MRMLLLIAVIGGVAYAYEPQATSAFVDSVAHGVQWGLGREIAHSLFTRLFH